MAVAARKTETVVMLHSSIVDLTRQDEADTLVQMRAIQDALAAQAYQVVTLPFTTGQALILQMQELDSPVVFNLVESIDNASEKLHLIPALLEACQVPFTGNGSSAMLLTTNKVLAKQIMKAHGIPTPLPLSEATDTDGLWIVKPTSEEGSFGVTYDCVLSAKEAQRKILEKSQDGEEWFAEQFIAGREYVVPVLEKANGPLVLPIAEILFGSEDAANRVFTYDAKWTEGHPDYEATIRHYCEKMDASPLFAELRTIALKAWKAFNLRGYARLDVRVDPQGRPWILEINANPDLSPDAGFAVAADRHGIPYTSLVDQLVMLAK